jgi:2-polyprenyl-6-hydroxyphenyl methylase/3-demethylubiquinone-9 3-methyltransferase
MHVHCEVLPDVARYIAKHRDLSLEEKEQEFRHQIQLIQRFKTVDSTTRILEIGTGTGSFPLLCKAHGIQCKGLEISPQLIEFAREVGRKWGIEPDIELGNIEEADIGNEDYDVIVASSVFEHVEQWELALQRVYRALKPGGALFFSSTNKFSITSGEYPMLFYGWLPDRLRYRFRIARQGEGIMKLGIDFNQFRYSQLRRAFRRAGFSRVLDRVDMKDPAGVADPRKRAILKLARRSRLVKTPVLLFCDATIFVCIK